MRSVWNFDIVILIATVDLQAPSARDICEALRWCDVLIYGLTALALVVSCLSRSSKVPERWPPREFSSGIHSGRNRDSRFLQPEGSARLVERGQTRRNKVVTNTARIATCTTTHYTHETSLRTIQPFRLAQQDRSRNSTHPTDAPNVVYLVCDKECCERSKH
jgi:hypothetical protein